MKIISFEIKDHYLIKDTVLEFSLSNSSNPADFIIFAGENGTGKTNILHLIYLLTKLKTNSKIFKTFLEIRILIEDFELKSFCLRSDSFNFLIDSKNTDNVITIKKTSNSNSITINFPYHNKTFQLKNLTHDDINTLKCFLGVQFVDNTNNLKSGNIHKSFRESIIVPEKSLKTDDTYIKRIAEEYFSERKGINKIIETPTKRESAIPLGKFIISKFNESYLKGDRAYYPTLYNDVRLPIEVDSINKCFKKINSNLQLVLDADEKSIYFTKDGFSKFNFSNLSTGEKRIIKINNITNFIAYNHGNPVLIDEPEIGLHPKWQKDMLSILKEYTKSHQFFICTHSPYILLDDSTMSKKVFSFNFENGNIHISDNLKFDDYEAQETIAIRAFNMQEIFKHSTKPLILVEGRSDERLFKHLASIKNINDIEIQWIGSYDKKSGQEEFSGEDNMKWLIKSLRNNPNLLNRKVCCVFDNDSNVSTSKVIKNLYRYKLMDSVNELSDKGIESLFEIINDFDFQGFVTITNHNNGQNIKKNINKMPLAEAITKFDDDKFLKICSKLNSSLNSILQFINSD